MDRAAIQYYSRKDLQDAMIKAGEHREVAVKFGSKGFGKRPDALKYPRDVQEFAKSGATSFHMSEELWRNPLEIQTGMKKNEVEELRIGWDLVLDIDFEEWNATKIITHALIEALRKHGIKSISCKFSGNKGFHIGVPFEAFPEKVAVKGEMTETKKLFPEGVQRIALYLMDHIDNKDNGFETSKKIIQSTEFQRYLDQNNLNQDSVSIDVCSKCGNEVKQKKEEKRIEFICPKCETRVIKKEDTKFLKCSKCNVLMEKFETEKTKICKCGGKDFAKKIDLKVDTLLISSRHLFRGVYSLHEKSGLASVPIDPLRVIEFDKKMADPEKLRISDYKFLDRENVERNEGSMLIVQAFDFKPDIEKEEIDEGKSDFEFKEVQEAIPEEFFPPCIKKILEGMEDGKKRGMFILVNFLTSVGWNYEAIEKILAEWNKKNTEPLKETLLTGQTRYHKYNKKKVLPPNCDNQMYYKDFQVCVPDNLCVKIKNPVTYSIRKTKYSRKKRKGDNVRESSNIDQKKAQAL